MCVFVFECHCLKLAGVQFRVFLGTLIEMYLTCTSCHLKEEVLIFMFTCRLYIILSYRLLEKVNILFFKNTFKVN